MQSVIKITVKILNQGTKSRSSNDAWEPLHFFQNESHDHGRGLMTSLLVLLIMIKLKHRE